MDRTVIITGASRGIGKATALKFAKEKDHLLLAGFKNEEALLSLQKELLEFTDEVYLFIGDLSKESECIRLFQMADEKFDSIDLLINNAGISHVELIQDSTDDNYLEILHANLSSVIRLSKEAVKRMVPKMQGKILNVSSVFGISGASMEAEYAATKGAINSFTKSLAKELALSNIQVNALAPGAIDTEMNGHLSEEDKEMLCDEIPMGRMGRAEEVADMLYLLSNAPSYLTGQIIQFDGGWM